MSFYVAYCVEKLERAVLAVQEVEQEVAQRGDPDLHAKVQECRRVLYDMLAEHYQSVGVVPRIDVDAFLRLEPLTVYRLA